MCLTSRNIYLAQTHFCKDCANVKRSEQSRRLDLLLSFLHKLFLKWKEALFHLFKYIPRMHSGLSSPPVNLRISAVQLAPAEGSTWRRMHIKEPPCLPQNPTKGILFPSIYTYIYWGIWFWCGECARGAGPGWTRFSCQKLAGHIAIFQSLLLITCNTLHIIAHDSLLLIWSFLPCLRASGRNLLSFHFRPIYLLKVTSLHL